MNKYLSSLLIIFIMAFASKANSQCPPGYQNTPLVMDFNGCLVNVNMCYNVFPGPPLIIDIIVNDITFNDPNDPNCVGLDINSPFFWNEVSNQIYEYAVLRHNSEIPPCDNDESIQISITRALCWLIINHDPNPELIGDEYSTLTPCDVDDPGKCYKNYKVCYDTNGNLQRTILSEGFIDSDLCEYDPLSEPIGTWGTSDECFQTCY